MTRWVSFVVHNPIRYNDPSGHNPIVWGIIGVTALLVGGYVADVTLGNIPDYIGINLAENAMGGNTGPIEVAAGLAVQGEFSWGDHIAAYIAHGDQNSASSGYGLAQAGAKELNGRDPDNPKVAIDVMTNRIKAAQDACIGCDAKGKLLAAALGQNGSGMVDKISKYTNKVSTSGGKINWEDFLRYGYIDTYTQGQPDAQIRQTITGSQYTTNFMLKKFMKNIRELHLRGWKLPEGISEADLEQLEKWGDELIQEPSNAR